MTMIQQILSVIGTIIVGIILEKVTKEAIVAFRRGKSTLKATISNKKTRFKIGLISIILFSIFMNILMNNTNTDSNPDISPIYVSNLLAHPEATEEVYVEETESIPTPTASPIKKKVTRKIIQTSPPEVEVVGVEIPVGTRLAGPKVNNSMPKYRPAQGGN